MNNNEKIACGVPIQGQFSASPFVQITGYEGRDIFTIHRDGSVTGDVEDASDAAAIFIREIREHFGVTPSATSSVPPMSPTSATDRTMSIQKLHEILRKVGVREDDMWEVTSAARGLALAKVWTNEPGA